MFTYTVPYTYMTIFIISQSNPTFHYLALEIMKVYNKYYIKPEKLIFCLYNYFWKFFENC